MRRLPDNPAFVACVLAAAEVQDRRIAREGSLIRSRVPPANAHCGAFARMDPEAHREASAKGGRSGQGEVKRREPFIANPMRHFGFTPSEFARYGEMRINTDLPQRTIAEIILRSRRPTPAPRA